MDEAVDEAVDEAKGCSIAVYMGCSNVPLNCNLTKESFTLSNKRRWRFTGMTSGQNKNQF